MADVPDGFDCDDGNREKCQKHGVAIAEIEAFFAGAPRRCLSHSRFGIA
jgi:uncharacterized DUF497 family protein